MKNISIILFIAFLGLSACNNKKAKVVEVVIYKAKEGVSYETALEKAKSVNEFVSQQDGFISRKMSVTKDQQWVDIVYWESLEQAEKATEAAMQAEAAGEYFQIIDEESITFLHGKHVFDLKK